MARHDELAAARRRLLIADLMVRQKDHGLTLSEIAQRLHEGKKHVGEDGQIETDPATVSQAPGGKPWNVSTISRDVDAIKEAWRKEAAKAVSEHKQEILAQYQRLLEIHWEGMDTAGVQSVLKEIRALLGTDTERIAIWEGVRESMDVAAKRLRAQFGDRPLLLAEIFAALSGKSGETKPPPN